MFHNLSLNFLNRFNRTAIWKQFAKKSSSIFKNSYLILSFDCDSEKDIALVSDIHNTLEDIGITPVYAVPGELLKKGESVYSKLFDKGAEFLNHGGRKHIYFDETLQREASCFFYDKQDTTTIRNDIYEGHQILLEVLGIQAKGFRTPHFGTFQDKQHLSLLYSILDELGYHFSTSTIPSKGYAFGPTYKVGKILEIPVTGRFTEPLNIFDTWGYFAAPDKQNNSNDYQQEAEFLATYCRKNPLLINIYGDPSHITKETDFFDSMKILADSAQNINFSQLLEITNEDHCTV